MEDVIEVRGFIFKKTSGGWWMTENKDLIYDPQTGKIRSNGVYIHKVSGRYPLNEEVSNANS